MKTVNQMKAEINRLKGQIASIEEAKVAENTATLVEEILNLKEGVGDGYREGDYYAPNRYYSSIPGVKNLRSYGGNNILVKVSTRKGYLLPSSVKIEGNEYTIVFAESDGYSDEVDY